MDLDPARTRHVEPAKLRSFGAIFNKPRQTWQVPAYKSLLPFMPYIMESTRICVYPGVFAKIEARVAARLEAEVSLGLMTQLERPNVLPKLRPTQPRILTLPKAPPGYMWESTPIDSGCTTLLKTSSRGFVDVNLHSKRSVRIADKKVIPVDGEGTFCFTVVSAGGKYIKFSAKNAVWSPGLRNLISSGMFEDMGHKVALEGETSHIELRYPGQPVEIVPLRCEGRLRYLDYLVPDDAATHMPHYALAPPRGLVVRCGDLTL